MSTDCLRSPTFLPPGDTRPHVAVASYPRSGSSLSRSVLEGLTGVWTGSDFCRNDTVNKARPAEWSEGESVHDRRVWLVKTHSRFKALVPELGAPTGDPFSLQALGEDYSIPVTYRCGQTAAKLVH